MSEFAKNVHTEAQDENDNDNTEESYYLVLYGRSSSIGFDNNKKGIPSPDEELPSLA